MKRAIYDVVIFMALAWLAMNLSLFGASERGDKYVQDVVNTHLTSLLYPYAPHPDITVLLLTDHALNTDGQQGRWPARYDFHGRVLKAVLAHAPKAVFIDFMWLSQRPQNPDGSFQDGELLLRQLKAFQDADIPVYLAESTAVRTNWPELDGLVRWVSVPLGFDVADFVARRYPPEEDGLETAAFLIAQQLYPERFVESPTRAMDIVWSAKLNEINHAWMKPGEAARETSLGDVLLKGYAGIGMDTPFSTTLFVRDLLNPVSNTPEAAQEELQRYLHKKIVLYGANLEGVNDLVFTPARNIQPGVYFHAMALDNLLNWGSNYKSETGTGDCIFLSHAWISMLAVLPVIVAFVWANHMARRRRPLRNVPKPLKTLLKLAHRHPAWRVSLSTAVLLMWFGAVAFFEYRYLNYSASVVVGYVQFIVAGFFIERTAMIDKLTARAKRYWAWLKNYPTIRRGDDCADFHRASCSSGIPAGHIADRIVTKSARARDPQKHQGNRPLRR